MITYELAKQLKDAGWKQAHKPFLPTEHEPREDDFITYPTLSELIEACGDKFALHKNKDHWKAWQINSNPREPNAANFEEIGPTPEEAVANLWLAINKK